MLPSKPRRPLRRALNWLLLTLAALIAATTAAPQLLAFPYSADFGPTRVYAERPIPPEMAQVLARADALTATSPLAIPALPRRIFLTSGGWRWSLLALTSRGALALRRPFRDAIVVNTNDVARDRVENGAPVGGVRTLSAVIAHETTHILVARRYGELHAMMLPTWKSEGYADYVSRSDSLTDAEYARFRVTGAAPRPRAYYEWHRQVAEALRRNGGDVDRLMAGRSGNATR